MYLLTFYIRLYYCYCNRLKAKGGNMQNHGISGACCSSRCRIDRYTPVDEVVWQTVRWVIRSIDRRMMSLSFG